MSRTQELRQAFERGAMWREDHLHLTSGAATPAAAKAYPMPTKTVPRTAVVGGVTYRYQKGRVEMQTLGAGWVRSSNFANDVPLVSLAHKHAQALDDVAKILDLIKNPTETVEVDE